MGVYIPQGLISRMTRATLDGTKAIMRMVGGDRDYICIELPVSGPLEGCVTGGVQGRQIYKHQKPVGRYLTLRVPEVSHPLLVIPFGNT